MSRIGNRVLTIPAGVEVNVDGNKITVKGADGATLKCVQVVVEDRTSTNGWKFAGGTGGTIETTFVIKSIL